MFNWIAVAAGIGVVCYGAATSWSDVRATRLYAVSPSCGIQATMHPAPGAPCIVEIAAITSAISRGGSRNPSLVVDVNANGRSEHIKLPGTPYVRSVFKTLRSGDRVHILRFVAKGFHLTGAAIGIANDTMATATMADPRIHLRSDIIQGILGFVLFAVGVQRSKASGV